MEELLLSKAYDTILTIGRKPSAINSDKIQHYSTDFKTMEIPDKHIGGNDLFVCFGTTQRAAGSKERFKEIDYGYPLSVIRSAYANGVQQVILVSSIGASSDSFSFYLQVKGQLEDAISQMNFWGTHILRPSLLLGKRQEYRLLEEIGQRIGRSLNFLAPRFIYKHKPIEASDVAKAMVSVAQSVKPGNYVYSSDTLHRMTNKII